MVKQVGAVNKIEAEILNQIDKSKSILLICHPSPDPDSVCSNLALKFGLEKMGKEVTLIAGDSKIPEAFMHFPGASSIVAKNLFEINIEDFDLFIILDISTPQQVSRFKPIEFPMKIKTILIDHHLSNKGFADIDYIEKDAPATGQIVYDLLKKWGIQIDQAIAANLMLAIYTDTVGLKTEISDPRTFEIFAELAKLTLNFSELMSKLENSEEPQKLKFYGIGLSNIESLLEDKLAISYVSNEELKKIGIDDLSMGASYISTMMKMVEKWKIVISAVEVSPNRIKASLRTNEPNNFDVSKLATELGGGGHKAAAGVNLIMSYDQAKKMIVAKAKELYNL
jgi:phosphoesterase RecJ-like protein